MGRVAGNWGGGSGLDDACGGRGCSGRLCQASPGSRTARLRERASCQVELLWGTLWRHTFAPRLPGCPPRCPPVQLYVAVGTAWATQRRALCMRRSEELGNRPQQAREKALLCGGIHEGTFAHSGFDVSGCLRADELSDGNEGVGMGGPRYWLPNSHSLLVH